ncbi:MAG TPA: MFS transporter [Candidatus Limnocylindrales bacterium]|nr:MFS transporter [Candidatus Limnocylindrales bacterium]
MSLWRNRDFNAYWFVNTVSVAGDSFSFIAIPLLVLQATGSVAQMGLPTGVAGAASIATGTFAGAIADRVDRRSLLIVCNVARAGLLSVIPLVWLLGPRLWLLYLVLPVSTAFGMIFQVAGVAVLPDLVSKEQIGVANGRLFAAQAVANIGGILLAGLMSAALGPSVAIGASTRRPSRWVRRDLW